MYINEILAIEQLKDAALQVILTMETPLERHLAKALNVLPSNVDIIKSVYLERYPRKDG